MITRRFARDFEKSCRKDFSENSKSKSARFFRFSDSDRRRKSLLTTHTTCVILTLYYKGETVKEKLLRAALRESSRRGYTAAWMNTSVRCFPESFFGKVVQTGAPIKGFRFSTGKGVSRRRRTNRKHSEKCCLLFALNGGFCFLRTAFVRRIIILRRHIPCRFTKSFRREAL